MFHDAVSRGFSEAGQGHMAYGDPAFKYLNRTTNGKGLISKQAYKNGIDQLISAYHVMLSPQRDP